MESEVSSVECDLFLRGQSVEWEAGECRVGSVKCEV